MAGVASMVRGTAPARGSAMLRTSAPLHGSGRICAHEVAPSLTKSPTRLHQRCAQINLARLRRDGREGDGPAPAVYHGLRGDSHEGSSPARGSAIRRWLVPLYLSAVMCVREVAPSLTKSPTRPGGQAMARRLRLDSGLGRQPSPEARRLRLASRPRRIPETKKAPAMRRPFPNV